MCEPEEKNSKMNTESSKELLYSEYVDTSVTQHVLQLIEKKTQPKPSMQFKKSSVLGKVMDFLTEMNENQEITEPKCENNIENIEEGKPYIEMSVTCLGVPEDMDNEKTAHSDSEDDDTSCLKILAVENFEDDSDSNDESNLDNDSDNSFSICLLPNIDSGNSPKKIELSNGSIHMNDNSNELSKNSTKSVCISEEET